MARTTIENWSPYPTKLNTSMIYQDYVTLDPPANGTAVVWIFRANSIFDPDVTGTGHQPRGHDQMALAYFQYTVTKCKYRFSTVYPQVSGGTGLVFGVHVSGDSTALLLNDYLESKRSKYKEFTINGSDSVVTIGGTVDIFRFLGKKVTDTPDSEVRALFSANPNEQVFLHVFMASLDPALTFNPPAMVVGSHLVYDVLLSEPQLLTQS